MSTDGTNMTNGHDAAAGEDRISVRSLWKVFGKNPMSVMTPGFAGKTKG